MGATKTEKKMNQYIALLIAALVGGIIILLPTPEGLTPDGQKSLGIFCSLIVLWATEPVPLPIIGIMMIPVTMGLGLIKLGPALHNFAVSSIFLIMGAFILAVGMSKTGFAERIIYMLMSKFGCTARRITLGITCANILLAFMVPSSAARTAVLLPVCLSLIEVFRKATGSEGRSNFGVGLLLTLAFTNATISAGILTATIPNPVTVDFILKATGKEISYQDWFMYGFPPALIMTFFSWWFISFVFKSEMKELPGGQNFISERLAAMGRMSRDEWKTCFIFLLVVALWMTGSLTKINSTVTVLVGVCLLFITKVITWEEANKTVAFKFMLNIGGGFLVANLLISTGAAKWVAENLFGLLRLEGASIAMTLIVVMLIVQYLHLPFMGTTKMATMIIPIIIGVAQSAGIDPVILALPAGMLVGGYPLFLFYNTISNLVVYGTNELRMSDFPKVGVPICTLACAVYALCALTYWPMLGLY